MTEENHPELSQDLSPSPETPNPEPGPDAEPQVFAVSFEAGKPAFSRREFLELAAAASVVATAIGCQVGGSPTPVKRNPSPMPRLFATLAPSDTAQVGVASPSATPEPSQPPMPEATSTPRPTNTPRPSATLSATPTQAVAGRAKGNVNLRSGPGTYYDKVGTTLPDERIQVLSRSEDSAWLRIITSTNLDCWISAEFVSATGKVSDLPVEANIPPAPTGVPGTVPPGFTGINYTLDGKTYTLRCGAPIPPEAVCTCNCVTVPGACGCDGDTGGGGGGCDGEGPGGHYWHPT
jgi:uncharacterized protein YraI